MHRNSCTVLTGSLFLALGACADNPTVPADTGPIQVSVVAATTGDIQSGQEIPVMATVINDRGRPYPNFLLNFNVLEGGGRMFGGAELTNSKGIARDIWTMGLGSCRHNTLSVRAVDASTGVGTTYATLSYTTLGMISFYSNRDGNPEIYVMNVDGSNQTRLTDNPAQENSSDWSPDGSKIAFNSNRDGNLEIYVMNADGSGVERLTNGDPADITPDWSPDGNKIVFVSNRWGSPDIFVMNADGSNHVRLTDNPGRELNPAWSPDGERIAFDSDLLNLIPGPPDEIFVMDANGSNPVNLTNNQADDTWPDWSPDGSKIVFDTNRASVGDNYEIYVMNADGSNPLNLTKFAAHNARPAWSRCVAF